MVKKSLYLEPYGKKTVIGKAKCRHIKECVYRSNDGTTCDYILKEKHSRGCPAGKCDKFKPKAK